MAVNSSQSRSVIENLRDNARRRTLQDVVLLCALGLIMLLPGAITLPLLDNDESRCASIVGTMVRHGDWLVPKLEGYVYYNKPPLYFWLAAAGQSLGVGCALSGRLVSILATVGTALLTYDLGRRMRGRRAGLLAAGMFLTTAFVFVFGQLYRMDMLLVLWMTLSMYAFARLEFGVDAGGRQRRRWWVLFYGAAALGTLTKGPVGLLVPGIAVVVYWVLTGQWRRAKELVNPLGIVLYLAAALPWFVFMALKYEDYLGAFLFEQNVDRFLTTFVHHAEPLWFYVPVMLLGVCPWSCLAGVAAMESFPASRRRLRERREDVLLWTWVVMVIVFFTVAQTKLMQYVLPTFPALALVIARSVEGRLDERAWTWAWMRYSLMVGAAFMLALAAGIVAAEMRLDVGVVGGVVFLGSTGVVTTGWLIILVRGTVGRVCLAIVGGIVLLAIVAAWCVQPGIYARQSYEKLGVLVSKHARLTDVVGFYGSQRCGFVVRAGRDSGVNFESAKDRPKLEPLLESGERVWLLVSPGRNEEEVLRASGGKVRVIIRWNEKVLMTNVEVGDL